MEFHQHQNDRFYSRSDNQNHSSQYFLCWPSFHRLMQFMRRRISFLEIIIFKSRYIYQFEPQNMKENKKITKLKIVILGNKSVGKSSIIRRYALDDFTSDIQATIGVDYMSKTIELEGQKFRLELWDTAGQQKFRSLVKGYLKNADGCIFVYDTKNINSYLGLSEWIDLFQSINTQNSSCIIAGNKIDLSTEKQLEEIQRAKQLSALSSKIDKFEEFLCSAKSNQNISKLFQRIALKSYEANGGKIQGSQNFLSKIGNGDIKCCSH